jgi:hypothetical protein
VVYQPPISNTYRLQTTTSPRQQGGVILYIKPQPYQGESDIFAYNIVAFGKYKKFFTKNHKKIK